MLQPNIAFTLERAPYARFTNFRWPNFKKFEYNTSMIGVKMNPFGIEF